MSSLRPHLLKKLLTANFAFLPFSKNPMNPITMRIHANSRQHINTNTNFVAAYQGNNENSNPKEALNNEK